MEKISISIGIPAYNEEKNIAKLLTKLFTQKTEKINITEIIVIASGCTDGTVELVKKFQSNINKKAPPLLHLIIEPERKGKAAAINTFLQKAKEDVCVIESADTLPEQNTIEYLCKPFLDKNIGLTGGHPIPTNKPDRFINFCIQMLWDLHHEVALENPKCGEIIAFRKIFSHIPSDSPVDESSIEFEINQKKLAIQYVPEAIVFNKGPETLREYAMQRRRINAGHRWLKKKYGYQVSTANFALLVKILGRYFIKNPRSIFWFIPMVILETISKIEAFYDIEIKKKDYARWQPISTSKKIDHT